MFHTTISDETISSAIDATSSSKFLFLGEMSLYPTIRFSCFEVAPGNGFICAFPEFKYLLNSHILIPLGMLSDKMVVFFPCSVILLYELFPGMVVVLLPLKRF